MFISLDLETTGFDPNKDKIIEFGAVKFNLSGEKERLQFLTNPGIKLPEIITHITGITDKDLEKAPKFSEKTEEIATFIGDLPIVGHNIQFDIEFLRANEIEIENPQYDTCQLASILLPGLPSYSLEILSHNLKLKHQEKHRAIDDSIAAMELFIKLGKTFQKLPQKLIKKIQNLCDKTTWPLKDYLKELKPIKSTTKKPKKPKAEEPETAQIPETHNSCLIEYSPPFEPLINSYIKKLDKDSYISLPNNIFKTIADTLPENIAKIDSPSRYLSLLRLKQFEEQENFTNYEFSTLLKLLVWQQTTETGHLSEITFFNEEKKVIPQINIDKNFNDPNEEYYFKKALESDISAPAICSHKYTIQFPHESKELIIFDIDQFQKSLSFEKSNYLKLDILLNQLKALGSSDTVESLSSTSTITFGLLGLIHEKYNDSNEYISRATLTQDLTQAAKWKELNQSVKNLIETSKELGKIKNEQTIPHLIKWKSSLQTLNDLILKPDLENNMIWIEKDFNENVIIRSYPYSITRDLHKILDSTENYKIISENLDLNDDGAFMKDLLGLHQSVPIIKTKEPREDMEILLANKFVNEKSFLSSYLKGETAIIFNSKQQLRQTTLALNDTLKEKGLTLVSQMTGSLGKLREQFKQDPKNSILLITPNFWQNFQDHGLIKTLIIHKIPFDPPSLPQIEAAQKTYDNAFTQYQVPVATFSLKKIINVLPASHEQKEVVILDSRIVEKDYGQLIRENLKTLATTKIVNLSTLAPNVKQNT